MDKDKALRDWAKATAPDFCKALLSQRDAMISYIQLFGDGLHDHLSYTLAPRRFARHIETLKTMFSTLEKDVPECVGDDAEPEKKKTPDSVTLKHSSETMVTLKWVPENEMGDMSRLVDRFKALDHKWIFDNMPARRVVYEADVCEVVLTHVLAYVVELVIDLIASTPSEKEIRLELQHQPVLEHPIYGEQRPDHACMVEYGEGNTRFASICEYKRKGFLSYEDWAEAVNMSGKERQPALAADQVGYGLLSHWFPQILKYTEALPCRQSMAVDGVEHFPMRWQKPDSREAKKNQAWVVRTWKTKLARKRGVKDVLHAPGLSFAYLTAIGLRRQDKDSNEGNEGSRQDASTDGVIDLFVKPA